MSFGATEEPWCAALDQEENHSICTVACIIPLTHLLADFCYKATLFVLVMVFQIRGLIVGLIALLAPVGLPAADVRSNSILLLDQSDLRGASRHRTFADMLTAIVFAMAKESDRRRLKVPSSAAMGGTARSSSATGAMRSLPQPVICAFVQITGLTMTELCQGVSELPQRTAVRLDAFPMAFQRKDLPNFFDPFFTTKQRVWE